VIPATDDRIRNPRAELPYILNTKDVARLLNVCAETARKEIRVAEKRGGVLVRWIGKGNQPRVNRDSFLAYLETRKGI